MRTVNGYLTILTWLIQLLASSSIDEGEVSLVGNVYSNISIATAAVAVELVFNESSDPIVVARELCRGKVKSCFVLAEAAVAIGQNKLYDKELKDWMWSDEFKYLFL
jgi:hypothetical protein